MNADRSSAAQHPHFVEIPDPQRDGGVRAYKEPDVAHPLQITFLDEAGEAAWIEEIRNVLSAGRADEADVRLTAGLAGFDGALARLCRATAVVDVALEGFEDLKPILAEWEGPPITAITLGLTNPPDLVFDGGQTHEPDLLLGLYSDEAFPFSSASKADLAAECAKELPAWFGAEEDVEFYCRVSGLAELNTALIHWKHRRFLRDGRDGVEGRAPGGYVEFVLGSWFLATRFLQAAERVVSDQGLAAGCRLIAGSIEVNADFVTILGSDASDPRAAHSASAAEPNFAPLTMKPWVPREDPTADAPTSGPTIRQRLIPVEPVEPAEARPSAEQPQGFLGRLFNRLRRG